MLFSGVFMLMFVAGFGGIDDGDEGEMLAMRWELGSSR